MNPYLNFSLEGKVALASLLVMCACSQKQAVTLTVSNSTDLNRADEMVEVSMERVAKKLHLADTAEVVVLDANGKQLPSQLTSGGKLIFPATVGANASVSYTIGVGTPEMVETSTCGRYYPERKDDIAWENDKVIFRAYGPALQASGERAYGYDVWVKNVPDMVAEKRYADDLNPKARAKIVELKDASKTEEADSLAKAISFHVDHGNGMDCYAVGPTLGCGTAALLAADSSIVYPYCYKEYEILDNGPLRFTVKLVYNPLVVNADSNVVETRILSLDKGSQLNKAVITYQNLSTATPVATGFVIHPDNSEAYKTEAQKGYIAYEDPTENVNNNNGKIYVGAVFPALVNEAKAVCFSKKESEELRGGATGHVLAISDYKPGTEYVYYWGSAWSKAGIDSMEKWESYLNEYAQKVRNPLTVTIK